MADPVKEFRKQFHTEIKLNLSVCFKGYLFRAIRKHNRHRFRMKSYSPFFTLIAEYLIEACMDTPFPGQLIPSAFIKGTDNL